MYLEILFVWNTENEIFKYENLGLESPLEESLKFFVFLGIAEISQIVQLSLIFKLYFSKRFRSILNYASTANNREIMKFYNLGDQSMISTSTDLETKSNRILR